MPKRPDTQDTVLLAIELLRRIPKKRKVTAQELHKQLNNLGIERDLRSIQRQLKELSNHFEIERDDSSKPYGYQWKERAPGLSVPMLTEKESLLLSLAEQHLKNLLPATIMESMDGFFEQARTNLRPNSYFNSGKYADAKQQREWMQKVRVVSTTQPLMPPVINPGVFEEVSEALYKNKWLKLEYENAKGLRYDAEVMPLGLAQQGPRLYLVCRYPDYTNERSLALHRIISAKATTRSFERPKEFDLEKYDNDGRFGYGEGKHILLSFSIAKNAGFHLLETPLSEDQEVTEEDDTYKIKATVVDTAQLEWWLRGFGDQVNDIHKELVSTNMQGNNIR